MNEFDGGCKIVKTKMPKQCAFFVETCAIKKGDFGLWPNFAFFAFFAKDLSDDVMKLNSAGSRHTIATF
jgi:hypothetical protein